MNIEKSSPQAMAFFSENYRDAAKMARQFAGDDGRIATLPDIIDARLATSLGKAPWEQYFGTNSAEYFGFTEGKTPIIIVAHGVGPLSTPQGMQEAYDRTPEPKHRVRAGGRISRKEFKDLEKGKYGEVSIVDFTNYQNRYEYTFLDSLYNTAALFDPLVNARLGPRTEEFIDRSSKESVYWAKEENERRQKGEVEIYGLKITRRINSNEMLKVIRVGDMSNLPYKFVSPDSEPLAAGLTIQQLVIMNNRALETDISPNEHLNPQRLVGIRGKGKIEDIIPSVYLDSEVIAQNLDRFLTPVNGERQIPQLFRLQKAGDRWFTQYPKDGESMDTGELEYIVTNLEPVEDKKEFATEWGGYYGFFKYGLNEVIAIAPEGANAYDLAGEIKIDGDFHRVPIQFYRVEVDTSRYLPTSKELEANYENLIYVASK